jgi:hypothetical protein
VARDAYGDGLAYLARLLRRHFGPDKTRTFVMLAVDFRMLRSNDVETQRIPVFHAS